MHVLDANTLLPELQQEACLQWYHCQVLAGQVPPIHYLDVTFTEETAMPLQLLLLFSLNDAPSTVCRLHGMQLMGPGEADVLLFRMLIGV